MERHVNSALTRDLSQTISCPWLLLGPLLPPPLGPVSLPLSPLPLSLNKSFCFSRKSHYTRRLSVYEREHGRVINPPSSFTLFFFSSLERVGLLTFKQKRSRQFINIRNFFFLAWRSLLLEECGSL